MMGGFPHPRTRDSHSDRNGKKGPVTATHENKRKRRNKVPHGGARKGRGGKESHISLLPLLSPLSPIHSMPSCLLFPLDPFRRPLSRFSASAPPLPFRQCRATSSNSSTSSSGFRPYYFFSLQIFGGCCGLRIFGRCGTLFFSGRTVCKGSG